MRYYAVTGQFDLDPRVVTPNPDHAREVAERLTRENPDQKFLLIEAETRVLGVVGIKPPEPAPVQWTAL